MKKVTRLVGGFVAGTTLAVAAFGSAAGADTADDVQIVIENAPTAIENLPERLQAVVDTYLETNSTQAAAMQAVTASSLTLQDLVSGTEQFAMVPLGYGLVALTATNLVNPYLGAIDDPSTAADLVNPDDLATIGGQAADALGGLSDDLTIAVIEGLKGNITAGVGFNAGLGTPATVGNVVAGTRDALYDLFDGTNYEGVGLFFAATAGVAAIATAPNVQQVEDGLAPIFEALAPAAAPIIDALGG